MKRQRSFTIAPFADGPRSFKKPRQVRAASVSQVKRMIAANTETKTFSYASTPIAVGSTGTMQLLSAIPQGVSVIERVGQDIEVQRMIFRYSIELADAYNFLRFIIVRCKDSGTDILTNDELVTFASTGYGYLGPVTYLNRDRFEVLHDSGTLPVHAGQPIRTGAVEINKKFKMTFNSSSIATMKNAIRVYAWSESVIISHPVLTYTTQIQFKDA